VLWLLSLSNNLASNFTQFGNIERKLFVWTAPTTFHLYPTALDKVMLAFLVVFFLVALATGVLRLAREMRLPVLAIIFAAILMPVWANGSWGADLRLPVAFPFILIASSRLEPTKAWQALAVGLCAVVASGLLFTRIFAVTVAWRDMDRKFAEFRAASSVMPAGARLMVVQSTMPDASRKIDGVPMALAYRSASQFWHMGTLAVIDRGAFVVNLFAKFQPVTPSPRNAGLDRGNWQPLTPEQLVQRAPAEFALDKLAMVKNEDNETPCCIDWPHVYDYVLWIDFGNPPPRVPEQLESVATGSYFHLYRVVKR
jgi:hypothetical protein